MQDVFEYHTKHTTKYIKENMPSLIQKFSKDIKREFLYGNSGQNEIRIGIEKGDHAGYWYIATLEECSEGTKIKGNIQYDPDGFTKANNKTNLISEICFWIFTVILCVVLFIPIFFYWFVGVITKRKSKEEYLDMFMKDYLQCEKVETTNSD